MARVKEIEGVVEELETYKVKTKYGKKNSFKVTIDDEEFTAFGEPDFDEGDTIEFEYKASGEYNNIVKDSIEVIERGDGPKKKKKSSGGSDKSNKGYSKGGNGAQFRSIPELNRIDALKLAVEINTAFNDVFELIDNAILFEAFITDGAESETLLNASLESPADVPEKKETKKKSTTKKKKEDPLDEE